MGNRRWTEKEETILVSLWGILHSPTIAKRLNRTSNAVNTRAYQMGLGPPSRGYVTIRDICRKTGYYESAVRNMAAWLGINIRRVAARDERSRRKQKARRSGIEEEDAERIIEAFREDGGQRVRFEQTRTGEWGNGSPTYVKPPKCLRCQTTDRPHLSRGLCSNCYKWALRHGKLELYPKVRRTEVDKEVD